MYNGTTSIIMPRWDTEEFMRLVEKHKVTMGMLATPMLLFFVDHPRNCDYDLSSLKKLMFAGAPVTAVVFRKAIEQFGNIFIHGFGTTETMGSATILRTEEIAQALAERRTDILSSCGNPIPTWKPRWWTSVVSPYCPVSSARSASAGKG
jgi:acyl-CoA synthetase (AMP-forming)/AMP-acid ligase II